MNVKRFSSPILRKAWIPYFILIFTLLISVVTMYFAGRETKKNDGLRFEGTVERLQFEIVGQLSSYITLLEGTSGLFAASETVTSEEFAFYVDRLKLAQRYPAIQGIGFLELVPAEQKEAFRMRIQQEGGEMADFTVWPESNLPVSTPITYIQPMNEQNAGTLGFDMGTESVRRKTMEAAARRGEATMSERVSLMQDDMTATRAGFLIFLPILNNEELTGFIYSPFHTDDFLQEVIGNEKSPQIDFRVYDGEISPDNLLHDSRNFGPFTPPSYAPRFYATRTVSVAGHEWTIEYTTNQAFDEVSDMWLVPFVLIFGLLTSGVLFSLSKAQYEAGRKAEISEGRLQYIAEAGKVLASSLDYKKTLKTVAQMGVPMLGDWCLVDSRIGNTIERIAIAHQDPEKVSWAKRYYKEDTLHLHKNSGLLQVIKTGKPALYSVFHEKENNSSFGAEIDFMKAKNWRVVSLMIVPLRVHKHVFGAMTYISTDSSRKYTEADLAVAEEIASRAAMAIEHARLFAGSEQAVKLRDEFISVASHELKTPVTSMKMYIQVVQRQLQKAGEEQLSQSMSKIDTQIDKMTMLIQDLLNVSRIQIGRLDFHDEWFDINQTVSNIVESVRPTAEKHTIIVHGKIKKKVYGDEDRIEQVIINLLSNAIKYSPDADTVEVHLSDEKDHILVKVRDYGIGIDERHIKKIFHRFYRVSDLDGKTFSGLGIGLFISHEIIDRHGGKLTVESKKGEGSVFGFTLPKRRLKKKKRNKKSA